MLRLLAFELNRIYCKYPKLKCEANEKLLSIIEQQICNIIGTEGLSNIC
jgi:hypothetical protein